MELIHLSDRMEHVHSDIRGELFHLANKMQREGTPVLKLNTGNPAAFGFPLPESIRNAIEGREREAVAYCDFQGMPAMPSSAMSGARASRVSSPTMYSSATVSARWSTSP